MNYRRVHTARSRHRRALCALWLLLAAIPSAVSAQQPSLHFTSSAVVSHHVARLTWDSVPNVQSYQLFRCYPNQDSFLPIATLAATTYFDTLRRVICADTVSYLLTARCADTAGGLPSDTLLFSDTVGLFFQDNIPTSPPTLRLCSVDTLLGQLRLSWYPAPDTDVLGYYICMGTPCLNLDTVWGRLNTTYLCADTLLLDSARQYSFRILAFDSCMQASPLTPYFHNPALSLDAPPCSRRLTCSWNRYINMPDSVARYVLHYQLGHNAAWLHHSVGAQGPFQFDTLVADLSTSLIRAYLSVHNTADSLTALSAIRTFAFPQPDTPQYAAILSADYVDSLSAISLSLQVDPLYPVDSCRLLRSLAHADASDASYRWDAFQPIATLHPSAEPNPQQTFYYTDRDINRNAPAYSYQLEMPDRCAQRYILSDTVVVTLPPKQEPAAWIPNIIKAGDPQVGKLCPALVAPTVRDYTFEVYSRQGQRLFSTHNLDDCWDGTGTLNKPLPQGVYVYRITCLHADGTRKTYTGTVTLLR